MKTIELRMAGGVALALAMGLASCSSSGPRPTYAVMDRGADTDEDGAADIDDGCPKEAEDGLLPKANDGCPASDADQDGILAGDDQCPDAKEDGQPPADKDGCPMADTDKDGVADALDKCPDKSEDNEAPSPNDGCPAPDTDRDGIHDGRDKCASQPETHNGWRDADGCPDTPPTVVTYDPDSATIYVPASQRLDFDYDAASLPPSSRATVREIARALKEHPDIERVEIEGHASTKGDAGYNRSLTERRASAVARALVEDGIAATRLVPIGYGELCLAVDTADDVDEPRNRRVLIKTVRVRGVWQDVPRGCWKAQAAGIDPTKRKPGVLAPSSPGVKESGGA